MRRYVPLALFNLVLVLVVIGCTGPRTEAERWAAHRTATTIIRDDYGVAHVYGTTDADAVFGVVYAQCEDGYRRIVRNYRWAMGRLAEVDGESALYSDLRARLYMTDAEAQAHYATTPAWLQRLCQAWADALNYYQAQHPHSLTGLPLRFEPWMALYFTEGSIGGDIEAVSLRHLQAFYSDTSLALAPDPIDRRADPQGSNGIALAGSRTASGHPLLLINPHTSFHFRSEYHMASDEGLNAYGAITWGQFFIYQGFNEKTGWMHTSSAADAIDEFVETISTQNSRLVYAYGAEQRPIQVDTVAITVKDSQGTHLRHFPRYRTHHGPITHRVDSGWVATALMWQPVKALEQSYLRTKQATYAGFEQVSRGLTNSSNNTVFASAEGTIAYLHANFLPRRDTAFDYRQPVPGANPRTDWQGLHPLEETIYLKNPSVGWLQNCNSTPFTVAGPDSPRPEAYPRYMSYAPENFRGLLARRLLPQAQGFTLDSLIALAYTPTLTAFEAVIPGLIAAYDAQPTRYPDLKAPIDTLRAWRYTSGAQSVGMTLAEFYGEALLASAPVPPGLEGTDSFAYYGTGLPPTERLRCLREALGKLTADFGRWDLPWGEVCRFQRLSDDNPPRFDDAQPSLPIGLGSARWGALAAYATTTGRGQTKKLYGIHGNSFVAVVEFGPRVKAKSLLAGGQSCDPQSPHFADQAALYTQGRFKDVAFYKEDVVARAKRTYHPGD